MFHFSTFPIHPEPLPLESLSSWLMRLINLNQLRSANGLKNMVHANWQNLERQPDTIPPNLDNFAKLTACDLETVRATTFYYFGTKFGRRKDHEGQRVGVLVKSDVAYHLRYCPRCLADEPHYKLTWRFRDIIGCTTHNIRLVERCPQCGNQHPVYAFKHQVGTCDHCGTDFSRAKAEPLSPEEQANNARITDEITFLLSPTPWDMDTVSRLVGAYWAAQRRLQSRDPRLFAKAAGINSEKLKSIENPTDPNTRGTRFRDYKAYVEQLGTTLEESFRHIAGWLADAPEIATWSQDDFYADALLAKLKAAQAQMEAAGETINQKKLGAAIGYDVPTLRYYPRLAAYLESFATDERVAQQRQERIAKQMRQAKAAVAQLEAAGETITHKAVGEILGRAPEGFDESVKQYLRDIIGSQEARFRAREAELVEAVRQAITSLEAEGERVTQGAVARLVDITPEGLKLYPAVAVIMDEIANNHQTYVENLPAKRIAALEQAEQTLLDQNKVITLDSLAAEIGIATVSLNHYPDVKAKAKEITERNKQRNQEMKRQEKENLLVHEIRHAEADLKAMGAPITRQAIIERLSISKRTVSRYKRANQLLNDIVARHNRS